jgi:hypothetical protein
MSVFIVAVGVFVSLINWIVTPTKYIWEAIFCSWVIVFLLAFAIWIRDEIMLYRIKKRVQKSIAFHSKHLILNAAEDLEKRLSRGNKGKDQIRILLRYVFLAMACGMDLSTIQEYYLEQYGLSVDYQTAYPSIGRSKSMVGEGVSVPAHGSLRLSFNGKFKDFLRLWKF